MPTFHLTKSTAKAKPINEDVNHIISLTTNDFQSFSHRFELQGSHIIYKHTFFASSRFISKMRFRGVFFFWLFEVVSNFKWLWDLFKERFLIYLWFFLNIYNFVRKTKEIKYFGKSIGLRLLKARKNSLWTKPNQRVFLNQSRRHGNLIELFAFYSNKLITWFIHGYSVDSNFNFTQKIFPRCFLVWGFKKILIKFLRDKMISLMISIFILEMRWD